MTNPDVTRYPEAAIARAAASFPTPFFLYEEERIRHNCRRLRAAFEKYFEGFTPLFAVKANPNPHLLRLVQEEGFGFDCSSPSEAWLLERLAGGGMYTGNYTTREEFEYLLTVPRLELNLDDISMVDVVASLDVPEFLSFRVNPGITAGGMESLHLAGEEAKFGVPAEHAVEGYRRLRARGVRRFGLHMMTGSNVREEAYFPFVARKLWEVAAAVHRDAGLTFECMNLGGGFGVPYRPEEKTLDLEAVARGVREAFEEGSGAAALAKPRLMVEPGRLILADAGFLVTTAHVLKDGYKKFVGVDAGMNDLPRPAIYGAYHHLSVLGKDGATEKVNVVGRLCENNDQFARDRALPPIAVGDVLVIHNAGAHSYAMGHNYNGRPRSDEYLLTSDGEFRHIRRAETIDDLFRTVVGDPFNDPPRRENDEG